MDIEEQPYDDRHGPREERFNPFDTPSKAVDPQGRSFRLSIPDAIDAVRQYRLEKPTMYPRTAEAIRVVTDELEARFNAERESESGLRYIAPAGKFAAYWDGRGDGPQLAPMSLLDLRVLSAHLTTAIDHVTAELELRRK